jgi:hypothetical protein
MRIRVPTEWVVYRMPVRGLADGLTAVCDQDEWEAKNSTQPGHYILIQAHIPNEGEAERLARGTAGDRPKTLPKLPPKG